MASLVIEVTASSDDAQVAGGIGYGESNTWMYVGEGGGGGTNYGCGWRFDGVTLTTDDTITSVKLSLEKHDNGWSFQSDRFTFIDADDAATFSSGDPPGSRAVVSTVIQDDHNENHLGGSVYDLPLQTLHQDQLAAALSEVIARGGWASGNAVALVDQSDQDAGSSDGFSRKQWETYDASVTPPTLTITYLPPETPGTIEAGPTSIGNDSSGAATTAAINTTGMDLIVLALTQEGSSITGPSDSYSNTWTPLHQMQITGQNVYIRLYYCELPTVGPGHTFAVSGSNVYPFLAASSWRGTKIAGSYEAESYDDATQPGSLTPSADGALLVSLADLQFADDYAVDSGFTIIYEYGDNESPYGNNWGIGYAYKIQSTAAAINPTWSNPGGGGVEPRWASVMAVFLAEPAAGPVVQYARPDSDVSRQNWTTNSGGTTNLYATIDETPANDSDYVRSSTSPGSPDTLEVTLTDVGDPAVSTGHKVRYRYAKDLASGDRIDLTVRLMQGASQIAAWTHTDIGTTLTDAEQTLSSGEADSITDYDDLRLQFEAVKV